MLQRFNAYIDGFNLYKGALEKRPELKWLDVRALCAALMPQCELDRVYYFTSRVKRRYDGDRAPDRQHLYLRALMSSKVDVVYGKTEKNENWMRIVSHKRDEFLEPNLASHFGLTQRALNKCFIKARPDQPKARVQFFGEKGTDVNIASYLLRDIYKNSDVCALVLSGDSDLITPIKFAGDEGVHVRVVIPNSGQRSARIKEVCSDVEFLDLDLVSANQFPQNFLSAKGRILRRPESWQ